MNSDIILGLLIAAISIVVFLLLIRFKNKKTVNKKVAPLLLFANENNTEILKYDICDKTLIGIDNKESNNLFFIRNISGNNTRSIIPLSDVYECKVYKAERKYMSSIIIDRLGLSLFCKNKSVIKLEFYNSEHDRLTINGELQLANKWEEIINNGLNKNKTELVC